MECSPPFVRNLRVREQWSPKIGRRMPRLCRGLRALFLVTTIRGRCGLRRIRKDKVPSSVLHLNGRLCDHELERRVQLPLDNLAVGQADLIRDLGVEIVLAESGDCRGELDWLLVLFADGEHELCHGISCSAPARSSRPIAMWSPAHIRPLGCIARSLVRAPRNPADLAWAGPGLPSA